MLSKQKEEYESNIKIQNDQISELDSQIKAKDSVIDKLNQTLVDTNQKISDFENLIEETKKEKESAVREVELQFNDQFIKLNDKNTNEVLKLKSEFNVATDEKNKMEELVQKYQNENDEINNQMKMRIKENLES
jgi:uncharacterized coiled-coil protein SlyX